MVDQDKQTYRLISYHDHPLMSGPTSTKASSGKSFRKPSQQMLNMQQASKSSFSVA
jgi:hypothetical protein